MIDRRREPGLHDLADEALESADALMRQADALLGRHRQSEPALDSWLPDEDDDLPLLTDVVELDGEPAQPDPPTAHSVPPATPAVSPADAWRMAMSASDSPAPPTTGPAFELPDWPDDFGLHDTPPSRSGKPLDPVATVIPAVTRRPAARELRDAPEPAWHPGSFEEQPPGHEPGSREPAFELPQWPAPPLASPPPAAPVPAPVHPAPATPAAPPPAIPATQPKAGASELLPPLEFSWPEVPHEAPAPPPQPPAVPAPPQIPLETLEARLIDWLASELPGLLQAELDVLSSRIERRLIERARSELLPALAEELGNQLAPAGAAQPGRSS